MMQHIVLLVLHPRILIQAWGPRLRMSILYLIYARLSVYLQCHTCSEDKLRLGFLGNDGNAHHLIVSPRGSFNIRRDELPCVGRTRGGGDGVWSDSDDPGTDGMKQT